MLNVPQEVRMGGASRSKRLGWAFAILAMLSVPGLWGGCGADDTSAGAAAPQPPGADRKTAVVTPGEGGTLTSADGRLTITIPPGAVSAATELWVESMPEAQAKAEFPEAIPEGVVYSLGPDGQQFAVPVSAALTLSMSEVPNTGEGIRLMTLVSRSTSHSDELLAASTTDGSGADAPVPLTRADFEAKTIAVVGDMTHFSKLSGTWVGTEGGVVAVIKPENVQAYFDEPWVSTFDIVNASMQTYYHRSIEMGPDYCSYIALVPPSGNGVCKSVDSACCFSHHGLDMFGGPPDYETKLYEPISPGSSVHLQGSFKCTESGANEGGSLLRYYGAISFTEVKHGPGAQFSAILNATCELLENGAVCTISTQCKSQNCAPEGVCCNTACTGTCQACNVTDLAGTCSAVPAGGSDDSCSGGTCDGAGACEIKKRLGEMCGGAAECASQNCAPEGVCCNDACTGECHACDASGTCTNVPVGQTDDSCTAPDACDGQGSCKLGNKKICASGDDAECASGHCEEFTCCATDCAGVCMACDVLGSEGTCTNVPSGQLDDTCSAPASCDGQGKCTGKPNGEQCASASECASGFCPPQDGVCCGSACDQLCMACASSKTPQPDGACSAVTYQTDPDNECAGALFCAGVNTCMAPLGEPCTIALPPTCSSSPGGCTPPCYSNMCVDGVCCASLCGGTCNSCKASDKGQIGTDGTCGPIQAGTDPYGECAGASTCSGASSCGP